VYSVLGIGFPSRATSVRARALGDGFLANDAASAVNPGAVGLVTPLTVSGVSGTTSRTYSANGVNVDGLRDTRFPLAMLRGPLGGSRLNFALSYSAYADRTYSLETSDTVNVRGTDVAVSDQLISDGGIAETRAAVGWNASLKIKLGVAVHLLSGSTRERVRRSFDDAQYGSVSQRGDVAYTGWGASVGAVLTPSERVRIGLAARKDGKLNVTEALLPTVRAHLPLTLTAGITVVPISAARWSVTGSWRSWGNARDDIPTGSNLTVFDTWEIGTGVELGGPDAGSRFPLRLGFRYATLPFSPTADQPREIDIAGGSAMTFARGRAVFEFAVERAIRDGGGASERAWHLFFGLTIRP
jgi:hypothetical protein